MNFLQYPLKYLLRLIEIIINRKIILHKFVKEKNHPLAASNGDSMYLFCEMINNLANFIPKNIFEIGANLGQDSEYLRKKFNLKSSDIYIFEPHPYLIKEAIKLYGFNSFSYAISDKNEKIQFNAIDLEKNLNSGISSIRLHNYNNKNEYLQIEVESMRMDKFIIENQITTIDFLKIDVEGSNFEVLKGFGDQLRIVKSVQIEAENIEVWEGQYLFEDISKLLISYDFELVHFELKDSCQSDSFWIKKNNIKQRY